MPAGERHTFGAGHELTVRHGAWSPKKVDPVADLLVRRAVDAVPFLADPAFGSAVWAWARAEARCQLLAEWLDDNGVLDEQGNPRPALDAATRLEKLALTHRQRLGLDPAARAGLEATLTHAAAGQAALEDAVRRGAEALGRREANGAAQSLPGAPPDAAEGLGQGS